jgi:hypothetical protein
MIDTFIAEKDAFGNAKLAHTHLQKAMKTNLGIAISGALVEVILEMVRSDYPALLQDFNRWENKVNWVDEPHKPMWFESLLDGLFMHARIAIMLAQKTADYEEKIRDHRYGNDVQDVNVETSFIIAHEIMTLENTADIRKFIKKLLHNQELMCKRGGKND